MFIIKKYFEHLYFMWKQQNVNYPVDLIIYSLLQEHNNLNQTCIKQYHCIVAPGSQIYLSLFQKQTWSTQDSYNKMSIYNYSLKSDNIHKISFLNCTWIKRRKNTMINDCSWDIEKVYIENKLFYNNSLMFQ